MPQKKLDLLKLTAGIVHIGLPLSTFLSGVAFVAVLLESFRQET